ncbi:MAG: hypothetical protein ABI462_03330 [Ignavibacteria bacterium]
MKKKILINLFCFLNLLYNGMSYSQNTQTDSVKIDYPKIYAYCLDGDVASAITALDKIDINNLSEKDRNFLTRFENRFINNTDADSLNSFPSPIADLQKIYRNYWRTSLLDNSKNYDTLLLNDLANFLTDDPKIAGTLIENEDTLNTYYIKYIESKGLHTTGFGKTGKYYDLLVWAAERDTTYNFLLHNENTSAEVVFMEDFISLGWQEYATLDRHYPGGWATKKALYCVRKAYDLESEQFLVSYLAHESRHFADYKLFPKLKSTDLEYRAKLTELSMAKTSLYKRSSRSIYTFKTKSCLEFQNKIICNVASS